MEGLTRDGRAAACPNALDTPDTTSLSLARSVNKSYLTYYSPKSVQQLIYNASLNRNTKVLDFIKSGGPSLTVSSNPTISLPGFCALPVFVLNCLPYEANAA